MATFTILDERKPLGVARLWFFSGVIASGVRKRSAVGPGKVIRLTGTTDPSSDSCWTGVL